VVAKQEAVKLDDSRVPQKGTNVAMQGGSSRSRDTQRRSHSMQSARTGNSRALIAYHIAYVYDSDSHDLYSVGKR
jgi:hypothetical protein